MDKFKEIYKNIPIEDVNYILHDNIYIHVIRRDAIHRVSPNQNPNNIETRFIASPQKQKKHL